MTEHREGPAGSVDSRGEPYVTYVAGIKQEGDSPVTFVSAAEAWGVFIETVAPVLADADVVEWRILPQENRTGDDSWRFYIRARLSAYKVN